MIDSWDVPGLLVVPLPVPTLQLTGDVPLVLAEVGQITGLEIDRMNGGHGVDERLANLPTRRA